jgi:hypothetical protein
MYNDYEVTGTEMTYIKPRTKHPFRTYLCEMSVIAGIAVVVASVLWWSWNR